MSDAMSSDGIDRREGGWFDTPSGRRWFPPKPVYWTDPDAELSRFLERLEKDRRAREAAAVEAPTRQ